MPSTELGYDIIVNAAGDAGAGRLSCQLHGLGDRILVVLG